MKGHKPSVSFRTSLRQLATNANHARGAAGSMLLALCLAAGAFAPGFGAQASVQRPSWRQSQTLALRSARTQSPPGPVTWLAAGDSYSSGEGVPGTGGPNDLCARSTRAYGPRAAAILRTTRGWTIPALTFTACTGAVIADFYHANPGKHEPAQHNAANRSYGGRYNVVTMSFGGNDVEFADTVKACLRMPKSFSDVVSGGGRDGCGVTDGDLQERVRELAAGQSPARPRVPYVHSNTGSTLADFYTAVASEHLRPDGVLVVVGYPRLFAPSDQWAPWRAGRCQHVVGADADMLGRAAVSLNSTLRDTVSKARGQLTGGRKIIYVDRLREFDNGGKSHSLCGNDTEWLTGLVIVSRNGEVRIERSFHPNEVGHQVTAEDVAGAVDARLRYPTPARGSTSHGPPSPEPTDEPSEDPSSISDGSQRFGIGDTFEASCSVAWPTAPTYTSDSIVMTMHCPEVPQQFLFVQVTYPDPGLAITPSTGQVTVHGRVTNFAKSAYGYQELLVTADDIDLNP